MRPVEKKSQTIVLHGVNRNWYYAGYPCVYEEYSSRFQSGKTNSPIVLEVTIQIKPESRRATGSRRKTFITRPVILNVFSGKKAGASRGFDLVDGEFSRLGSGNFICMSANSMSLSS